MRTTRFALGMGLVFAALGMASACGGKTESGGTTGSSGTGVAGSAGEAVVGPCENSAAVLEAHAIREPSRLLSTDKPIVASAGVEGAEYLVDGEYSTSRAGVFGTLAAGPQWVAIDVGEGPSRLLLLLTDAGTDNYTNVNDGGTPVSYSIETSSDSTDGDDGEWEMVAEVTDNSVRNRAHSFDFDGMRWVRFTATEAPKNRSVKLIELALHDLSNAMDGRPTDSWLFFGDSIHRNAMHQARSGVASFERVVAEAHPGFSPVMLNASIARERLSDAINRLDELIELNPDIEHFAIAYGTNDSWGNKHPEAIGFRDELVEVVETILDAGHTPVIARIPYASEAHVTLPEFNAVIDEVQVEYGLPCGPDLYGHFLEHPEQLKGDGVHPNAQGDAAINQLWAAAASPLYGDD